MSTAQFACVYSPKIKGKKNQRINIKEVNKKIVTFYSVYAPEKLQDQANHEKLIRYTINNGYLALCRKIKAKYSVNLGEADNSPQGWYRLRVSLGNFYLAHKAERTDKELFDTIKWTKKKGVAALDAKLKEKYGESLSEFGARGVLKWKDDWNKTLTDFGKEHFKYQLSRFYAVMQSMFNVYKGPDEVEKLVQWAIDHTRLDVNERLLHKYGLSLDDVKMIKGVTDAERMITLSAALTEFLQTYDTKKLYKLDTVKQLATEGIVRYEELNARLKEEFGADLEDATRAKISQLLSVFYAKHGTQKEPEQLQNIINFGVDKGVAALNELLTVKYGDNLDSITADDDDDD